MNVVVSGNRSCCLSHQLGSDVYLFAVANGFGQIGGEAAASLALGKLDREFERRARSSRFRCARQRPRSFAGALHGALARVNDELHARSASHEDYVTAAASMTAILLVRERAYLAHIGSTAGYLMRGGSTIALTKNDSFDEEPAVPILVRALGLTPSADVVISAFALSDGDALLLAGRRLPEASEALMIKFSAVEETQVPAPIEAHTAPSILTALLATVLFYTLLAIR